LRESGSVIRNSDQEGDERLLMAPREFVDKSKAYSVAKLESSGVRVLY